MILCCGEALIDMIPTPTMAGRDGFVPHTGGAVFNTAIALSRLGVETGMLSGVSTDAFGAELLAELEKSGVATRFLVRSDRPTTLAFVTLDDGQARYSFFDENSAGRMVSIRDFPEITSDVEVLFLGGISLVCEPGADAYLGLVEREAHTQTIMVDPNIRSGFIEDEARYRARLDRVLRCADIVKVSDEDLAWIKPDARDLDNAARLMQQEYNCLLIVTRGREGALAYLPFGDIRRTMARKVDVVDTVGAGDAFNAGFLASLFESKNLSKAGISSLSAQAVDAALSFASAVAALTVSKPGADPPARSDVI